MYYRKGKQKKKTEDTDHEDQRCNEDLQTAEPHHAGRFGVQMEQAADLWRQGGHRRVLFQWPEQALLLRGGLRIPGRRPHLRRRHRAEGGKRSRVRG